MRALAFSGGKDSMACLHLMRDTLDFAIYIDTGFTYPETRAIVNYAHTIVPVRIIESTRPDVIPADLVPVDWTEMGQIFTTKKDVTILPYHECCFASLAVPLNTAAAEFGVTELVVGQRNEEGHKSTARDSDMVMGIKRIHPIENWTTAEVMAYLATKMEIPEHYAIKHSSLDCYDCTAYRKDSRDRIEYTRQKHPVFFSAYATRKAALDNAISEAMNG
tara:strand:- start:2157 stop:2813 length:657 start_codon:yes stop_codon:yes gene_type:complete